MFFVFPWAMVTFIIIQVFFVILGFAVFCVTLIGHGHGHGLGHAHQHHRLKEL